MHVFTWRRALALGAVAVLTGFVVAIASSGGSASTAREVKMTKLQRRILSGYASFELGTTPGNEATARTSATNLKPVSNPTAAACPTHHGNNVKVNQNCLNVSDRDLQGRGQAQNESAIAVNPRTGQLVANLTTIGVAMAPAVRPTPAAGRAGAMPRFPTTLCAGRRLVAWPASTCKAAAIPQPPGTQRATSTTTPAKSSSAGPA